MTNHHVHSVWLIIVLPRLNHTVGSLSLHVRYIISVAHLSARLQQVHITSHPLAPMAHVPLRPEDIDLRTWQHCWQ